jgi:WD40 repeat protein
MDILHRTEYKGWALSFLGGCLSCVFCSPVPTGLGQLLVWEWQSESYVLKQQGHFNSMVSLAYSPDGQYIVTGGDDGKVGTRVLC